MISTAIFMNRYEKPTADRATEIIQAQNLDSPTMADWEKALEQAVSEIGGDRKAEAENSAGDGTDKTMGDW